MYDEVTITAQMLLPPDRLRNNPPLTRESHDCIFRELIDDQHVQLNIR